MGFSCFTGRMFASALGLACGVGIAQAESVSIVASKDSFISEHPNWGGPTSVNGTRDYMHSVYGFTSGSGHWRTFPLIAFDLAAYTGRTVDTSQPIELQLMMTQSNVKATQALTISSMLVDWNETSTSFANIGGTGFNASAQVGATLLTSSITWHGGPETVSFSLPASAIQSWMDSPSQNFGIILFAAPSPNQPDDKVFLSRESSTAPLLSFALAPVPEAGRFALTLTGLFGLLAFTRIKRQRIKGEA